MLWKIGGWVLLISHFWWDAPYREQILALQTIISTLAPSLMPFHLATVFVVFLYLVQLGDNVTEFVPLVLHHVIVFISVLSEYYFKEWRYTCAVVLCWSMRWMNPSNIYLEHPLRAMLRCILFGVLISRQFSLERAIRWCWLFLVHESLYIFVPVQMLYEVYMKKRPRAVVEIV
jgi:hypothetical protein